MMAVNEDFESIHDVIDAIQLPEEGAYNLCQIESHVFLGKDSSGHVVSIIESSDCTGTQQSMQSTRGLLLHTDANCIAQDSVKVFGHLLVCLSDDVVDQEAFIRLTSSLAGKKKSSSEIIGFFNSLSKLFKHDTKSDIHAIEGLFGELYTI
jgi:hypothetical protein